MAVVRNAASFEARAKFTTWLYTVARSKMIDHWRARDDAVSMAYFAGDAANDADEAVLDVPASDALRPDHQVMARAEARAFLQAVEALPPLQREAFLLQAEGGLSLENAAHLAAHETVKSRLRYAIQAAPAWSRAGLWTAIWRWYDSAMSGAARADRSYRQATADWKNAVASRAASILALRLPKLGEAVTPRAVPCSAAWPLAAAADVMRSTLAVMMEICTSEEAAVHEAPTPRLYARCRQYAPPAPLTAAPMAEQAPAQRSAKDQSALQSQPATQAAARAPAAPMVEKSISNSDTKDAQAVERPLAQTQERSLGRLKKDSEGVAQAPREARPPVVTEAPATMGAKEEDRARQNVPAASPAVPAPEPAARPKLRPEQGAVAGAAAPAPPWIKRGRRTTRRSEARRDGTVSAAQSERKQVRVGRAWLERIIKLRREGRHDEADAELKRFASAIHKCNCRGSVVASGNALDASSIVASDHGDRADNAACQARGIGFEHARCAAREIKRSVQ